MRGRLAPHQTRDSVRWCGRKMLGPTVAVLPGSGDGEVGAGFGGLVTCGSVWVCPVCAGKIAAERVQELSHVLNWAVDQGKTIAMVTLTMRHKGKSGRLAKAWDGATAGWSAITSGGGWKSESEEKYADRLAAWYAKPPSKRRRKPVRRIGAAEEYGVTGWVKAVEATHGKNGWHVHVHAIMILDDAVSDSRLQEFGNCLFARWERGLAKKGYTALRDSGGLDVTRITAGEDLAPYLVKMAAVEATTGGFKEGRGENRTPFQIAQDLIDAGEARDQQLWLEWSEGSLGRRQMGWSVGLRKAAGLGAAKTDEEIADERVMGDAEVFIFRDDWRNRVRDDYDLQDSILEVIQTRGAARLHDYLSWIGIEHAYHPSPPPEPDQENTGPPIVRHEE